VPVRRLLAQLHCSPMNSAHWLLFGCSSASFCGDLLIFSRSVFTGRSSFAVHALGCNAVADAVGQLVFINGIIGAAYHTPPESPGLCVFQAFVSWSLVWSSWAWMIVYAHAVRRAFEHLQQGDATAGLWPAKQQVWLWYAACCGGPLCAAFAVAVRNGYGHRGDLPICSVTPTGIRLASHMMLFAVLVHNSYCFLQVELLMRRSLRLGAGLLHPDESSSAARRLRLWPRFTCYIVAFLVSQAPLTVFILLKTVEGGNEAPALLQRGSWLSLLGHALTFSHGSFNALLCLWFEGADAWGKCAGRLRRVLSRSRSFTLSVMMRRSSPVTESEPAIIEH